MHWRVRDVRRGVNFEGNWTEPERKPNGAAGRAHSVCRATQCQGCTTTRPQRLGPPYKKIKNLLHSSKPATRYLSMHVAKQQTTTDIIPSMHFRPHSSRNMIRQVTVVWGCPHRRRWRAPGIPAWRPERSLPRIPCCSLPAPTGNQTQATGLDRARAARTTPPPHDVRGTGELRSNQIRQSAECAQQPPSLARPATVIIHTY